MSIDYTRPYAKWPTSFVLVLVLWTGFAFVEHQFDIDERHHEHHNCDLFSHALHAISSTVPILPVVVQKPIKPNAVSIASVIKTAPVEKARAPPASSIYT